MSASHTYKYLDRYNNACKKAQKINEKRNETLSFVPLQTSATAIASPASLNIVFGRATRTYCKDDV